MEKSFDYDKFVETVKTDETVRSEATHIQGTAPEVSNIHKRCVRRAATKVLDFSRGKGKSKGWMQQANARQPKGCSLHYVAVHIRLAVNIALEETLPKLPLIKVIGP